MEYLDFYDENGKYIGKEERSVVHRDALWHKTVHCWLYDKEGNIFFQIRKGEGLYTTASGHVKSGETVKEGFGREILEEIGIDLDIDSAELMEINKFSIDILKKDGTLFRDRAFANIFLYDFEDDYEKFKFDENEIEGLVKINAKDVLNVLANKCDSAEGTALKKEQNTVVANKISIKLDDFLINKGETGIGKYGKVLNKIIDITE